MAVLQVIGKERVCEKFFEYTPGLGPAQHIQEMRLAQSEDVNRKLQGRQIWIAVGEVFLSLAGVAVAVLAIWFFTGDAEHTVNVTLPTEEIDQQEPTAMPTPESP